MNCWSKKEVWLYPVSEAGGPMFPEEIGVILTGSDIGGRCPII